MNHAITLLVTLQDLLRTEGQQFICLLICFVSLNILTHPHSINAHMHISTCMQLICAFGYFHKHVYVNM